MFQYTEQDTRLTRDYFKISVVSVLRLVQSLVVIVVVV